MVLRKEKRKGRREGWWRIKLRGVLEIGSIYQNLNKLCFNYPPGKYKCMRHVVSKNVCIKEFQWSQNGLSEHVHCMHVLYTNVREGMRIFTPDKYG